ncbi:MAG TPA: VOC family protein [Parvularculaceae bacterium]|nr:VOC family protein [Parvularculaceae bacterium]
MAKVLGVGGVFLKAKDQAALRDWYARVLGLEIADWGGAVFTPDAMVAKPGAATVWSLFDADSDYFLPSTKGMMINLVVDDLDALLSRCKAEGVEPLKIVSDQSMGRFAHIMDPEGLKIELWEPKPMAG